MAYGIQITPFVFINITHDMSTNVCTINLVQLLFRKGRLANKTSLSGTLDSFDMAYTKTSVPIL